MGFRGRNDIFGWLINTQPFRLKFRFCRITISNRLKYGQFQLGGHPHD